MSSTAITQLRKQLVLFFLLPYIGMAVVNLFSFTWKNIVSISVKGFGI